MPTWSAAGPMRSGEMRAWLLWATPAACGDLNCVISSRFKHVGHTEAERGRFCGDASHLDSRNAANRSADALQVNLIIRSIQKSIAVRCVLAKNRTSVWCHCVQLCSLITTLTFFAGRNMRVCKSAASVAANRFPAPSCRTQGQLECSASTSCISSQIYGPWQLFAAPAAAHNQSRPDSCMQYSLYSAQKNRGRQHQQAQHTD